MFDIQDQLTQKEGLVKYTTCLRFKSRKTCTTSSDSQAGSVDHKNNNSSAKQSTSSNILRFRWMSKDKDETKTRSNLISGSLTKPKRPSKLPIIKDIIPIAASAEDSLITEDQTNAQAAPRLSLGSMKYVDDTDTGTDILSELNALSEQIIETDTSNNLTPTLADVEPNKLSTSQTLTNKQLGIINELNKLSKSDRTTSGKLNELDSRSGTLIDHRFQAISTLNTGTPLSSNSLSRPTSAQSVQSGHSGTSSISDILAHQPLKASYTLDNRHYRVGGPAYFCNVPSKNNSIVQSTATGQQSSTLTSSDTTQFYSRPSSKQAGYITEQRIKLNNLNLSARQSIDLNEDESKSNEKRDLRCKDQTRCLLTLRRKAELRKRKSRFDSYALLDLAYKTERFLLNSRNWNFNSFTLDTISELFENGYHDTNPYHNSVHASDVSQAMHCFIEQEKIKPYLTPLEAMCSLMAAVSHDLDHPGVNQHFLVATNSHLAALYENLSVLESHHWRFAMSCIHESEIFSHFDSAQMNQVQNYISSLILATDITQQQHYLKRFRTLLGYGRPRVSPNSTNLPSTLNSPQHLSKTSFATQQSSLSSNVSKTLAAPSNVGSFYTSSGGQSPVRFVRTPSDKRRPFATIGSSLLEGDLTSTLIKTTTAFTGTMMDALKLHVGGNDQSIQPIDKYQLDLNNSEHRLFILQIALKCADLGNPCRVWPLSKQWTTQICNEFYRQGDFERRLNMDVSPICDRYTASIAQIQRDFFRNIVSPLFCLWHRFLNSPLSHKMICNLTFNNAQWLSTLGKVVGKRRHSISSCSAGEYAKIINKQIENTLGAGSSVTDKQITASLSLSDLNEDEHPSIKKLFKKKNTSEWSKSFSQWLNDQKDFSSSIQLPHLSDVIINVTQPLDSDNQSPEENDCDQYPTLQHSSSFSNRQDHSVNQRLVDMQRNTHPLISTSSTGRIAEREEDYRDQIDLFQNTLHAIQPQFLQTARTSEMRRGSAPCIGINIDIFMLLQHAQKPATSTGSNINNNNLSSTPSTYPWKLNSKHQKRRSSFPVADFSPNCIQLNKKIPPGKNVTTLTTTAVTAVTSSPVSKLANSKNCSQQFKELTMENMKKLISTGRHAFSLDSNADCKQWLISKRRSSIPQEILIESMRNYQ